MRTIVAYETQARRLLKRHLETTTQAAFARRVGVGQQMVSDWAAGKSRPEALLRLVIERVAGIDPTLWLLAEERRRIDAA